MKTISFEADDDGVLLTLLSVLLLSLLLFSLLLLLLSLLLLLLLLSILLDFLDFLLLKKILESLVLYVATKSPLLILEDEDLLLETILLFLFTRYEVNVPYIN